MGTLTPPVAVGTHAGGRQQRRRRASLVCVDREGAPRSRSGMRDASLAGGGGAEKELASRARARPRTQSRSHPVSQRNSTESLGRAERIRHPRASRSARSETPTSARNRAASSSLSSSSSSPSRSLALPNSLLDRSISV